MATGTRSHVRPGPSTAWSASAAAPSARMASSAPASAASTRRSARTVSFAQRSSSPRRTSAALRASTVRTARPPATRSVMIRPFAPTLVLLARTASVVWATTRPARVTSSIRSRAPRDFTASLRARRPRAAGCARAAFTAPRVPPFRSRPPRDFTPSSRVPCSRRRVYLVLTRQPSSRPRVTRVRQARRARRTACTLLTSARPVLSDPSRSSTLCRARPALRARGRRTGSCGSVASASSAPREPRVRWTA
mmetsp:Transcript_72241/g.205376  ORF Transcript_72241/g.205376 Transcript_72241/m.205376 type:complete len:250 (+) Transcript_72241:3454-4203(+)